MEIRGDFVKMLRILRIAVKGKTKWGLGKEIRVYECDVFHRFSEIN